MHDLGVENNNFSYMRTNRFLNYIARLMVWAKRGDEIVMTYGMQLKDWI